MKINYNVCNENVILLKLILILKLFDYFWKRYSGMFYFFMKTDIYSNMYILINIVCVYNNIYIYKCIFVVLY